MAQSSKTDNIRNIFIYFAAYTLIWLAAVIFICHFYRAQGKDILWVLDGVYQHFPAFNYICDITESLLHGHMDLSGILPFNYTIGQGADLFTTLNSYDFADPVSWLCASMIFVSRVHRYSLMVFSKLWLTGAAFSVFCLLTERLNKQAVLCGALLYTFSANILLMFAMHPNFINWAYFLPLMLGGYERCRKSGKGLLLMFSVFGNLLTSFYTFYINAILLLLYVLARNTAAWSKDRRKEVLLAELRLDLRAAGICLAGVLLCAFSFFPTLYAYTQNPRIGGLNGYTASMLHYDLQYYKDILPAFFSATKQANYTTVIGISCISLPAILYFCLFSSDDRTGKNRALKLFGALQLIMLGIPMAGRVMNGMSYACNRWTYAIVFTMSVMVARTFSELAERGISKGIILSKPAESVIGEGAESSRQNETGRKAEAGREAVSGRQNETGRQAETGRQVTAGIMTAVTLLCVFYQSYCIFSPARGNYVSEFEAVKEHDYNNSDSSRALSGVSSARDFFRVESRESTNNVDGINKVNSTSVWWSMYPGSMLEYLNAFESNAISQNCNFSGLGLRTALLELAGVRYYTSPVSVPAMVPYGYVHSKELSDSEYNVYENTLPLPVGYAFQNYIRRDAFDALGPVQKQEAVLQGVVLDEDDCKDLPEQAAEITADPKAYELEYEIGELNDVTMTDDTITAKSGDAGIKINADIPENMEVYLQIEGIEIEYPDASNVFVVRYNESPKFKESRAGKISNLTSKWPVIRDGITYDLGVGDGGRTTFRIRFSAAGKFTYDDIKLWAVPMDSYASRVKELQNNSMADIRVTGKEISGSIDVPESRILQIAVPYSAGWSASVDGKREKLLNSDLLYMALVVPQGHHEIVLRYRTPYLLSGAAVSVLTLLWCFITSRRRAGKERAKEEKKRTGRR